MTSPADTMFLAGTWSRIIRALVVACLVSAGCARGINIPRPDLGPSRPVPAPEPSTIAVSVSVDLQSIFREVENAVPKRMPASSDWMVVDKNAIGDLGVRFEIWRDPLGLSVGDNRLRLESRVYYWFEAAQRVPKPIIGGSFWQELGSCGKGEPPREAMVGLETALAWSADWQLTSKTTVRPTAYANQCKVTFLKINVTDRVDGAFRTALTQAATMADNRLRASGNVRSQAERVWKALQEPVRLDSAVWLVVDPRTAFAAPLAGSGQTLSVAAGFTAQPRVTYGARPVVSQVALPPLQVKPAAGGLHVVVDADLSYEDANRELARRLVPSRHKVGSHTVDVVDAKMYGSGDAAVLQLVLAGDIQGTVYLAGKPVFDPATGVLSIDDIDYTIETSQTLVNVADWLNHESFRQAVAAKARLPMTEHLARARVEIEKALNRTLAPNVTLSGAVKAVRPVAVFVTPAGFKARVVVDGSAAISVR